MKQEDRLNMAQFGWANGMRNMVFVAGRLRRNKDNASAFLLQQTPSIAQSIPVRTRFALSDQFPDGSYISVFARLRGRTWIDPNGQAGDSGVILQCLHTRFTNGQEVDPDVAQRRLMSFLQRTPAEADVDTGIQAMDIETPEEIKGFVGDQPETEAVAKAEAQDPYALVKRDNRLLSNGNHAQIAGVIGFMEYRESQADPSLSRVQLYIQQSSALEESVIVRVYGKQAVLVANAYRPGHAVYASGEIQVDVKKIDGALKMTPYLKTYSVESAQKPHIKLSPYPDWAVQLFNEGSTDAGFARLCRFIKAGPKTEAKPADAN